MIRPLVLTVLVATGVAIAEPPASTPSTTTTPTTAPKTDAPKIQPKKETKPEAKEATLKVGSKAPAIKADKWVKGSEVKSFDAGKVYVMEFWATWCPPCKESIPHLTELQKSHKDITVIGMASSEGHGKPVTPKHLENLEKFVKDKGNEMNYTVAYDPSAAMGKDWLRAAGQTGIPCAFVVGGDGKIVWIGNPLNTEKLTAAVDQALKDAKATATTPVTTPAPKKS